jgi:hypothetical protein
MKKRSSFVVYRSRETKISPVDSSALDIPMMMMTCWIIGELLLVCVGRQIAMTPELLHLLGIGILSKAELMSTISPVLIEPVGYARGVVVPRGMTGNRGMTAHLDHHR